MRQVFVLLFALFTLVCCKKNDNIVNPIDTKLAGQWEMISAEDKSTSEVFTKPASVPNNIDISISFTSAAQGNVSGVLTMATSVKGKFSITQNRGMAIPSMDFSYPAFDAFGGSASWDQQFSNNITLCDSYFFDASEHLTISCRNNKVLTFVKK